MTLLVASIPVHDIEAARRDVARAFTRGATGVELRIDGFPDSPESIASLVQSHPDRAWIVTCRTKVEGGLSDLAAEDRVDRLSAAAAATAAYIDFEYASFRASATARERLLRIARLPDGRPRLILSSHDFQGVPPDLRGRIAEMSAVPEAAAVKIAYTPSNICDSFLALDVLREATKPTIAIAMGESGIMTRVLAPKLGAFATFCALDAGTATAPGQVTLDDMTGLYRFASINAETRFLGVIGCPVAHSMSPLLHNRWLADAGINAVYLPLLVDREPGVFQGFLDGCMDRPWLHAAGFSVTLPHKDVAGRWVRRTYYTGAGDGVNTILMPEAIRAAESEDPANWRAPPERWHDVPWDSDHPEDPQGFTSDGIAARASLCAARDCSGFDFKGIAVDVLGTGGAARAVISALRACECQVTIYGRNPDRRNALARESGARASAWEHRAQRSGQIVINCTSLGMWPNTEESPLPADAFGGCELAFDLVYNPPRTRFLADAEAAGARILTGVDMFVRQAAMQFEAWTGVNPDSTAGAGIVLARLGASAMAGRAIALIGYRGSGKSTVARALSTRLGVPVIDTDVEIIRSTGTSISDLFARCGEASFRDMESRAVRDAVDHLMKTTTPTGSRITGVLSLGGGAVLDQRNVGLVRSAAMVVWLTAPPEVLWQRIAAHAASATSRPALSSAGGLEEVQLILAQRTPLYRAAADVVVDTVGKSPEQITEEIEKAVFEMRP